MEAQGGARLYLAGEMLIDIWQGGAKTSRVVFLDPGFFYDLRVEFYSLDDQHSLTLRYASSNFMSQVEDISIHPHFLEPTEMVLKFFWGIFSTERHALVMELALLAILAT